MEDEFRSGVTDKLEPVQAKDKLRRGGSSHGNVVQAHGEETGVARKRQQTRSPRVPGADPRVHYPFQRDRRAGSIAVEYGTDGKIAEGSRQGHGGREERVVVRSTSQLVIVTVDLGGGNSETDAIGRTPNKNDTPNVPKM